MTYTWYTLSTHLTLSLWLKSGKQPSQKIWRKEIQHKKPQMYSCKVEMLFI